MFKISSASVSLFGIFLVIGIASTACTAGGDGEQAEEPAIGTVQVVTDASQITLPLDAYILATDDYLTVQRAAWQMISDCVERFGGVYSMSEEAFVASLGVADLGSSNARRYGLMDPDSASQYGYNLSPDQQPPAAEERGSGWDPSDTELLLVRGTESGVSADELPTDVEGDRLPEDGCQGEATRAGSAGLEAPPNLQLPNELSMESHDRSQNDSRVRDAMDDWSGCMAESGYDYATVWEANDAEWPDPVQSEEIATAAADVACKVDTNLAGVWSTVESAYQERMIGEDIEALEAIGEYNQARAGRAADILAGG